MSAWSCGLQPTLSLHPFGGLPILVSSGKVQCMRHLPRIENVFCIFFLSELMVRLGVTLSSDQCLMNAVFILSSWDVLLLVGGSGACQHRRASACSKCPSCLRCIYLPDPCCEGQDKTPEATPMTENSAQPWDFPFQLGLPG